MKLWQKTYTVDTLVDTFTVGEDRILDLQLARYDVQGSMAHATMLQRIGVLSAEELESLLRELRSIAADIEAGEFTIEDEFEDVHSKVEHLLTERLGETGKKIHTARSRNDQVLVDLHLYARAELDAIHEAVYLLFDRLLALAEEHKGVTLPGYTHLQVAMPSSFGLWFSGYAETLIDDLRLVAAARATADQNPLGSAAGYGSSFPIDRQLTTELLDFATLRYASTGAQMSRGKLERTVAFALSSLGDTLGKLAADICLFMSQNFGFIGFPRELTTGSSIMPHKQNPDVFELVRAKSNQLRALPGEIALLTANLTSGYHRDFQLLKAPLLNGVATTREILEVTEFMLRHIRVRGISSKDDRYDYMYSVETVNRLVQEGTPFRDAYRMVGQQIDAGAFRAERELQHSHAGSLGNLCLAEIRAKMEACAPRKVAE